MERLTDAIRCMTAVKEISLRWISLPDSAACDMLMESLVANQEGNPNLSFIDLREAGGDWNGHFSEAAKAHIATLKEQGVDIKEMW